LFSNSFWRAAHAGGPEVAEVAKIALA